MQRAVSGRRRDGRVVHGNFRQDRHSGLPDLLRLEAQRIRARRDRGRTRSGATEMAGAAKKAPGQTLRKLLVQAGEERVERTERMARGARRVEKTSSVDRAPETKSERRHASHLSWGYCQNISRPFSGAEIYLAAGLRRQRNGESMNTSVARRSSPSKSLRKLVTSAAIALFVSGASSLAQENGSGKDWPKG